MANKTVNLTLDEVSRGQGFRDGFRMYPSSEEMIRPIVDALEGEFSEIRIQAKEPKQLPSQDGAVVHYYPRVLCEFVLNDRYQLDRGNERYRKVIGFLYAFDVKKPVVKLYEGFERHACLNLCIFSAAQIIEQEFDQNYSIPSLVSPMLSNIDEQLSQLEVFHDAMMIPMTGSRVNETLGALLKRACVPGSDLNVGAVTQAAAFIGGPADVKGIKNIYYNDAGEYTAFTVYQAMIAGKTPDEAGNVKTLNRPEQLLEAYTAFSGALQLDVNQAVTETTNVDVQVEITAEVTEPTEEANIVDEQASNIDTDSDDGSEVLG